jgi:carbon-monoxide dehydrogenase iron sulfur subunit
MEKVLIVDGDKCTGCQVCELVCSMVRSGEYNLRSSCIKVMKNRELDVNIPVISVGCDFCGECAKWCFPQAINFVNLEEAAIVRKKAAIGCFPAPVVG